METDIYKLHNKIKHYEWGSTQLLPQFLGIENSRGIPHAEMWMGTHRLSASQVQRDGRSVSLTEISGELPFLFKLLAVEKPLSIQAHPNKTQAAEGFNREEAAGLSLKNPMRNYKDPNHKPEIVCAITPFTLMAGFREPERICKSLEEFLSIALPLKEIISSLFRALEAGSLSSFFRILNNFSSLERQYLGNFILEKKPVSGGEISPEQWELMKSLAAAYSGDPAVISPLYLNLLTLQPGQAVFVPAGTLHAYVKGFAAELMANSDNVLRGGLTPKYVDTGELMKILYFVPFIPQIITPPESPGWYCYYTPCSDFTLALMRGGEMVFPEKEQAICIVTEGELKACGRTIKKGESFFIPKTDGDILFDGDYSLFAAYAGSAGAETGNVP